MRTLSRGRKKLFVLSGSTLAKGLLRRDFTFTRRELQRAAERTSKMKQQIASQFHRISQHKMENVRGRDIFELQKVLQYQKELNRNTDARRKAMMRGERTGRTQVMPSLSLFPERRRR